MTYLSRYAVYFNRSFSENRKQACLFGNRIYAWWFQSCSTSFLLALSRTGSTASSKQHELLSRIQKPFLSKLGSG